MSKRQKETPSPPKKRVLRSGTKDIVGRGTNRKKRADLETPPVAKKKGPNQEKMVICNWWVILRLNNDNYISFMKRLLLLIIHRLKHQVPSKPTLWVKYLHENLPKKSKNYYWFTQWIFSFHLIRARSQIFHNNNKNTISQQQKNTRRLISKHNRRHSVKSNWLLHLKMHSLKLNWIQ